MPTDHHFLIAGARWLWRFTRLRGSANGWCGDRKVWIHDSLKGRKRLEIICHEYIHAAYPQLSEEAVTQGARDLARILWQLDYRSDR